MSTLRARTIILFADLSSSTLIGESVDPEQLAELLAQLRKLAEDVITKHGGVINQFYGDGVLAAFGFLKPREDDVLHAITAALELHETVAQIPPIKGKDFPDIKIQLHSGIHADLVFVQDGDSIQGRYKLTGDALNTAARLSDAADPGEILVSASTICNLLPFFETIYVPPLSLKGKRKTLEAYKVLKRTDIRTRYEASLQQGLKDFVGRQQELELMFLYFSEAEQGHCRYFELCGDPGIGKTRLSEEFLIQLPKTTVIFKAYCEDGDSGGPLQPFIQMMNNLFGLKSNASTPDSRASFKQTLNKHYPSLAQYEKEYLYLLELSGTDSQEQEQADLAIPEAGTQETDYSMLAQRSIAAISALIGHFSASKTVVLYLDDWHLADDLSSKTLLHLMHSLEQKPIFVLAATRTASFEFANFKGMSLQLNCLSLKESTLLASGLFNNVMLKQYARMLYEQSGGNPLFIEELCQTITASPTPQIFEHQISSIPVTLSSLISARMNRLPNELQQLVSIAAVLGNNFDQWLFEAMATPKLTTKLLADLANYDVIYQGCTQGTLRFKHGITREVAYEKVGFYEKRKYHREAVYFLEQNLQQNGSEKYYELLTYHCLGAENQLKTGMYAELAGDRAMATMALDRAGLQYKRALKALDPVSCPESTYTNWKSILLKFGWVSVFDPLQEHTDTFQRGLVLAEQNEDYEALAKIHYWLAYLAYSLGDSNNAIAHCEKVLEQVDKLGASPLQVETTALLGQAKGAACDYDTAINLLDCAMNAKLEHKKGQHLAVGSAYSLACKGMILGDQGLFDQAYQCFESALESLRGEDYFHVESSVLGLYSAVNLWQGRWQAAQQIAEQATKATQRISRSYMSSIYISLSSYATWKMDGHESASNIILAQTGILEKHHKFLFLSLNYGWLAEMFVAAKKWQTARKFAARALIQARHQDRLGEAMAYRALAMIAEHHQPGSCQKYMDRAMASAAARHSQHETAKNNLLWASILINQKRFDPAQHILRNTLRDFQKMNMPYYEQKAAKLIQSNIASA